MGTGLFLGTATTIQMAGPSVLLGYAVAGFIAFLIMRQLGEMVAEEPVTGHSAILPINTGVVLPVFIRLELLGNVCSGGHGGTDGSRRVY